MIHDEIVGYEVAKLAKEKGFNIHCTPFYALDNFTAEYVDDVGDFYEVDFEKGDLYQNYPIKGSLHKAKMLPAPTQSLLQRWLREEKNIHIEFVATACGYLWIADKTNGTAITDSDVLDRGTNEGGCWDEYELALEDALKYALEKLL